MLCARWLYELSSSASVVEQVKMEYCIPSRNARNFSRTHEQSVTVSSILTPLSLVYNS